MTKETESTIPQFFAGRKIFVTGGTGFMGKVLLSKILNCCPEVEEIYLLIRENRGVDPQTRIRNIFQQEPFRELREKHPERLKKVHAVAGDVSLEGLALSEENRKRIKSDVSVVFHMAACVRFDMSLKTAVKLNTGGTANVLAFSKQIDHLVSFVHVSTSYCQCGETVLEERYYPTKVSPESVLSVVDNMEDNVLLAMTEQLIGDQPNTYAFSKSLSEDLVARSGLPVGVARPSIVVASWKEPTAGWIENLHGPTGLMIGAGKGVIRSMLANGKYASDVIPCDNAVNATIALAWKVAKEKENSPIFMNITGNRENALTWGDAVEIGRKCLYEFPLSGPLWYPGGNVTSSRIIHAFVVLFFQLIPAYFLDGLLMLTGNKPFLVRIQTKVRLGLELLQYYTSKEWIFRNDTMESLQADLCPADREIFFMDTKTIRWDEYILSYILGIRKYCLKDDPSTLPRARRIFMYLHVAHWCLKIAFCLLLFWIISSWMGTLKTEQIALIK